MKEILKKHWWEPLLLILIAVVCYFWWRTSQSGEQGAVAEVTYNGQAVMEIPLDRDGLYALKEDPSIHFAVKDGAVAFVDADCPDKICEKEGFLSRNGQTAVCLPRKTRLQVKAESKGDGGPDVIAR